MTIHKPCQTLYETGIKIDAFRPLVPDATLYHNLEVSIQDLTFTRPHITLVVQYVCFYIHKPQEPHIGSFKCIM